MLFYRFGKYELDLTDESLRQDGVKLPINRRMFQVLRLLIERRGELVSKEEFFETVWEGGFVEDNNLTVTVRSLRKVLGDDARDARFIENIPRKGYRFVADATAHPRPAAADSTARSVAPAAIPLRPVKGPAAPRVIAIGTTIALIVILAIASSGGKGLLPAAGSPARAIDSIAVLPFEDPSAESAYIANGLTDSIIDDLSKLTRLRVIDRNSTFNYRSGSSDPEKAGRELSVRAVVTGHIERQDNLVLVDVVMVDSEGGSQIWQQQFKRSANEIFTLQQEIAEAIAKNVQGTDEFVRRPLKRPTNDAEAYDLYLKGRFYWNKRNNPDISKAIEMFRAAIERDPTFAKAYIGLADAYTLGGLPGVSNDEKIALSRGAVQRALEIDDSLGEAYASMAINKCYYDWNFAGAESDYIKAIKLSPNNATAHHWYAEFLSMQGRFDESYAEYEKALAIDPLSMPIRTDMALSRYYARDYDKAIDLLIRAKNIEPNYRRTYSFLMLTYREKGMYLDATDAVEEDMNRVFGANERAGAEYKNISSHIAAIKKQGSDLNAERYWRTELEFESDPAPILKAVAYAKLGDADKAFEYLERAFNARFSGMVWLKVSPEFDGIRSDPRFADLMKRVGFDPA